MSKNPSVDELLDYINQLSDEEQQLLRRRLSGRELPDVSHISEADQAKWSDAQKKTVRIPRPRLDDSDLQEFTANRMWMNAEE